MNASNLPDEIVEVFDDATVKLIAMQIGVLDRILNHPQTYIYVVPDHATHWMTFASYAGFKNPADNGFYLRAHPKSRYSEREWKESTSALMEAGGMDIQGAEFLDPPTNERSN